MIPVFIDEEEFEVMVALEKVRRYRNKQSNPNVGFDKLTEIMDTIIAVAQNNPTCPDCGSDKLYVKIRK